MKRFERERRDAEDWQVISGSLGRAAPGRPKGRKDKLNEQVIETLEKLCVNRGAEIIDHLAAEKPEIVAQLVAKLIPQELATQASRVRRRKCQGRSTGYDHG